jgi:hypothetical protein
MTRTAINLLVVCLLALPTAALADDVYQLNPPPDIYINNFTTQDGLNLTGEVETIGDALNTGCYSAECPITADLTFTATSGSFTISDGSTNYLTANYVPGSYVLDSGGEVGIEYLVTYDNESAWNTQELLYAVSTHTQSATNLPVGTEMVLDLHNYGGGNNAYADMTPAGAPAAAPESATLTLLGSGLSAGLLRKRLARKKA